MDVTSFYKCSWREYVLRRDGFYKNRSYAFEHTRAIVFAIVCSVSDPKVTMQEYWPLDTDPTQEEINKSGEAKRLRGIMKQFKEKTGVYAR